MHHQPKSSPRAQAKWLEIEKLATKLIEHSETQDEYQPAPKSPLAGDDTHSQPYHVSHAVQMNITSAADHLHATCTLVLRTGFLHLAAPATLARSVLECASTAIWIASPTTRDERITRALKWNIADVRDGDRAATGAGLPVPTSLQDRKAKIEAVANKRPCSSSRSAAATRAPTRQRPPRTTSSPRSA